MERTLLLTKAQNAEISRDFQTAARLYKELLNLEPDNLEYLSSLGSIYVKSNEDEKALPYYQKIIELFPHSVSAMNSVGAIFRRLKRYDESMEILKRALEENKDTATVNYTLGFTYREMKLYDEAIECFEKVVSENPNDVLAYNHLGSIYSAKEEYQVAIENFKHGLQIDQNHPILNYNIAHCYEALEVFPEAIRSYENALKTKPAWPEAIRDFSNLLLTCNKTKEAQNLVQRSLRLYPNDASMLCVLGQIFLTQYDFDSAEKTFKKANSITPENVEILSGLAEALEKGEKIQEALDAIENAIAIEPENIDLQKQLAGTLLSASDFEEAFRKIDTLYKENEDDLQILDLYSQYYACMGDEESTNYYHKRIDQVDKNYKKHLLSTAKRFSQIGKKERAESYAKNYIEKHVNDPEGYNVLGKVYAKAGDYDNAIISYNKGIELSKDNIFANKQLSELLKQRIANRIEQAASTTEEKKNESEETSENLNFTKENSAFDFDLLGQDEKEDVAADSAEHFWDNLSDEFEDKLDSDEILSDAKDKYNINSIVPNNVEENLDETLPENQSDENSTGLEELDDEGFDSLKDLMPNMQEDVTSTMPIDDPYDNFELDDFYPEESEMQGQEKSENIENVDSNDLYVNPAQQNDIESFPEQNDQLSDSLQQKLQESIINSANAAMETALNAQRMANQIAEEQDKITSLQKALEEKQQETEQMQEELVMQQIKAEQLQLSLLEKQQDELAEKESEKQNIGLDPIENPIEEPTEELVDQPVIETEIKTENESEVEQIKLPEESESNKIDEFASLDDLCAETSDDTNFETPIENESVADDNELDGLEEITELEEVSDFENVDNIIMNEIENDDDNISSQQMFYLVNDNIVPDIDDNQKEPKEDSSSINDLIMEILIGEYEFPSVDTILADMLLQLTDAELAIIASIPEKSDKIEKTEEIDNFATVEEVSEEQPEDNFETVDEVTKENNTNNFDTFEADISSEDTTEEDTFDKVDSILDEGQFASDIDILTNEDSECNWDEEIEEKSKPTELQDLFHKVEEMMGDDVISKLYKDELEMFRKLKMLIDFLPADLQNSVDTEKLRVQIEYIISRISGRPGLCKTISLLFESGFIEKDLEKSTVDNDKNLSSEQVKSVLENTKVLARNLEDSLLADALCKLADEVLEKM